MKKATAYLFLSSFALGMTLYSCSKQELGLPQPQKDEKGKPYFESKDELVTWVNNSENTTKTKKLGEFEFTLKRLTPDMMALQELQGKTGDAAAYEEARLHYTDLIYYKLNIRNSNFHKELLRYNLTSGQEYTDRVNYCAFQINRDVYLTNGHDSVPCAIHEFERTFNIESGLNFVLAFPLIDLKKSHTLVFEDLLFKNGIIKFAFGKDSNELPYFKIK